MRRGLVADKRPYCFSGFQVQHVRHSRLRREETLREFVPRAGGKTRPARFVRTCVFISERLTFVALYWDPQAF